MSRYSHQIRNGRVIYQGHDVGGFTKVEQRLTGQFGTVFYCDEWISGEHVARSRGDLADKLIEDHIREQRRQENTQ